MKRTRHDWFVMRVMTNDPFWAHPACKGVNDNSDKPSVLFPYGGTLSEVKDYINTFPSKDIKSTLSWVPAEFVIEYVFGEITY
jgi:hypothetical protein